jgi:hypothetical protein
MSDLTASVATLVASATACAEAVRAGASGLTDEKLIASQRELGAATRLIEVAASFLAAEVAHRSRRELGHTGLAQRLGARTPQSLVQSVSGASAPAARRLVSLGGLIAESASPDLPSTEAWLEPLARAARRGQLSAEAVEVIRAGLGSPSETVNAAELARAASILVDESRTLTVERLAARARELRDEVDAAGVAQRESEQRERRYLSLTPLPDGMTRLAGLLDPESAAVVVAAVDAATSPRRGGPRFVEPSAASAAQKLLDDTRTTGQIALDAVVELMDVAIRSASSTTLGARRPAVRVLVTQRDLDRRSASLNGTSAGRENHGMGHLEGRGAAVTLATVDRHACDGGLQPILFDDDGQTLNLGRAQRLHNARQRAAIAARDGGCLAPDCDRPPSWCEVHHINEYSRGGATDVATGVLLCRHHHLLLHNNGWRIILMHGQYWLTPPPDVDRAQQPILLASKSPAMRRMRATA